MSLALFFYLFVVILAVNVSAKQPGSNEFSPTIHIITAFLWPFILISFLWQYIEKE